MEATSAFIRLGSSIYSVKHVLKVSSASSPDSLVAIIPDGTVQSILVSKAILCQTCDYFVKALEGEFKEAGERTLRLPGWSVDVVQLFIYWAYKWKLPTVADHTPGSSGQIEATKQAQLNLVRLWMFGDQHFIPRMQNAAMERLLRLSGNTPTATEAIELAFQEAPKDSTLSRFALDEARYRYFNSEPSLSEEALEELALNRGFLTAFMEPVRKRLSVVNPHMSYQIYKSARWHGLEAYQVNVGEAGEQGLHLG